MPRGSPRRLGGILSGLSAIDLHSYLQALQGLSTANSVEDITEVCRSHSRQLGFDAFIYALRVPTRFSEARVVVINGFPDPWLDRYWEHGYSASDPVVGHCGRHVVPIRWHQLRFATSSRSAQIMHEASDFGLRAGISMPVHSPQGELGILSLTLDRDTVGAREVTDRALPYVQLLAGHVHEAVRRVCNLVVTTGRQPLTSREEECLRWAADGKTSWEISQLLTMSERTVNFHLNNAMIKLDVCNRQHAVAKAVLQGLINPHPF